MPSLFQEKIPLNLPDSDIWYMPNFLILEEANSIFNHLRQEVEWQQDDITVFGKTHPQPRLTALYGNNGKPYSYSNITMQPEAFSDALLNVKKKIESHFDSIFTTCLLNLYRDGKDSNGWHSDDERELGKNPIIASISLGQERFFHLRHKHDRELKHKLLLEHGSLLMMQGTTQHHWQHQLPKTSRSIGERINLTFRVIQ